MEEAKRAQNEFEALRGKYKDKNPFEVPLRVIWMNGTSYQKTSLSSTGTRYSPPEIRRLCISPCKMKANSCLSLSPSC